MENERIGTFKMNGNCPYLEKCKKDANEAVNVWCKKDYKTCNRFKIYELSKRS